MSRPWCSLKDCCITQSCLCSSRCTHMHTAGKTQHRILSCCLISWTSTQQTRISSNWFGKTQRDPPPARVRKHDWSHMTAHSWYIFSRPPHPHAHQQPLFPNHTYVSSLFIPPATLSGSASSARQGGASGARHFDIVPPASWVLQDHTHIWTHVRRHTLNTRRWDAGICAWGRGMCRHVRGAHIRTQSF